MGAALAHHGQSETGQTPRPVSLARFHSGTPECPALERSLPSPSLSSSQTTSTPHSHFSPTVISWSPCISSSGCFSSHQLHTPFTYPSPATSSLGPLLWKRGHKATEVSPTMSSPLETRQKISSRSITPSLFHSRSHPIVNQQRP